MAECYMCDQEATTDEHAPPQCIFPESKDVPDGTDYRKNLITVPSCETHNLKTSADDEYLMATIVLHFENNMVAVQQAGSKVQRALVRKNGALAKRILQGNRPAEVDGKPTRAVQVEITRIYAELEKIGRALFFNHHGIKWLDPIWVATTSIVSEDPKVNQLAKQLKYLNAELFGNFPRHGENPDVFYYQITPVEALPQAAIRLVFYGGFEAAVVKRA